MAKVSFMRKQAPTFSVPNLADISTEYVALTEKRDKLAAQLGKLQTEHSALMEEIAQETVSQASRERDARVALLLGDESVASISRPHARLSEINREIPDLKAALAVLGDQIGQARYRASEKILDDVRPMYAQRIEAICNALLVLRTASADYVALTDELREKDISWLSLNPMPAGFAGNPHDRNGRIGNYLREAARHGYFPYDQIPTELR